MTLDEINETEKRDNAAFEKWLNTDRDLFWLSPSAKRDLIIYVAGLHGQIGDLKMQLEELNERH